MGVKDLWHILSPLCERKPLFELQGKTIAIDLSCWVVDSQSIADDSVNPKMYLRNLYFRTAFILMQGISPVFVLEGRAPMLKHNTIAKRNNMRGRYQKKKTNSRGGRSQFKRILNECKEMLQYMGLACVQGHGEAEAMCAYLNKDGLVDGCISQDSDCFLYGAKVVYRNFCTSAQGNRGGSNGSVDEYKLEKIERILELGRNKMIALALLCGCDYDEGLSGVGKEAAMKLLKIVKDEDILDRLKSWKRKSGLDLMETELMNPNICSSCGHNGKVQKHVRSGCEDCGTITKCNDSYKEKRALLLNEIALRKKALCIENFPNQELIDEFLIRKDPVPTKIDIQWKQPQVTKFIDFMEKYLSWEPQYAFEKIFPLVTRWQLVHLPKISIENRAIIPDLFVPEAIKKIRNIRSVASYEIIWKTDHTLIEKLKEYIELDQETETDDVDPLSVLTSIEPQDAVQKCYPELVQVFEDARNAKTKRRKKKNAVESDGNVEKNGKTEKRQRKRNGKLLTTPKNNKKLDEIVTEVCPVSLGESFESLIISPKRSRKVTGARGQKREKDKIKRGPQFDKVLQTENANLKLNNTLDRMFNELSPDDFITDNDDGSDISDIIDNICAERIFHFDDTRDVQIVEDKWDVCEKRIENLESEVNYVVNTRKKSDQQQNDQLQKKSELFDEFDNMNESYVPLNQRIFNEKSKKFEQIPVETNCRYTFGIDSLMNDSGLEI